MGENTCSDSVGPSRSSSGGDIWLTAQVEQAMSIPQGLVLWPDTPSVRLTAAVDNQDISSHEAALKISRSSSPMTFGESTESDDKREGRFGTTVNGQTGQEDLVLKLRLPKMPAVVDSSEEDLADPSLSLRVEVLVGRVVTAAGTMDFRGDELQAILSGSNSRRTVVKLTGGGEMVFLLHCRGGGGSSTGPREQFPKTHAGLPSLPSVCEGSRPQANDGSEKAGPQATRLEHFLQSIACRGIPASGINSKSLPDVSAAAEAVEGGGPEEWDGQSGDHGDSLFRALVDWLSRSHPDPAFLRIALEKANSYAFPQVEAPFLAALLKHGGLVGEAFQAVEAMSTGGKGERSSTKMLPVRI